MWLRLALPSSAYSPFLSHILACRPRTTSTTALDAAYAAPCAAQLTIRRLQHAQQTPLPTTFRNGVATEPGYCSTSYQEAAGTRSSTRKVAGSAPKWRRTPLERSSNTAWASPSADSSTSPSTSHTTNTERVDSPSSPVWDCFQTKWRVKISLPEAYATSPDSTLSAEALSRGRKVSPSRVSLSSSASPNCARSKPPAGTTCRRETEL